MLKKESRARLLYNYRSPFEGRLYSGKEVERDSDERGSTRREFNSDELRQLFSMPDLLVRPPMDPSNDEDVQLAQAKFWAILIALYTGMRLSEIAKLYPSDFRLERNIPIIDLQATKDRKFKTRRGIKDDFRFIQI